MYNAELDTIQLGVAFHAIEYHARNVKNDI